ISIGVPFAREAAGALVVGYGKAGDVEKAVQAVEWLASARNSDDGAEFEGVAEAIVELEKAVGAAAPLKARLGTAVKLLGSQQA
ncbi:hypothetical protein HK104_006217, partial [Borealophlyctis nickersoniae]